MSGVTQEGYHLNIQPVVDASSSWRCHTIVGRQWSLRNTARPRRSPAMPAPGSAFMILARPMAAH